MRSLSTRSRTVHTFALQQSFTVVNTVTVASSRKCLSRCKFPHEVSIVLYSSFPREGNRRTRGPSRVPRISSNCFIPITSDTTDNATSGTLPAPSYRAGDVDRMSSDTLVESVFVLSRSEGHGRAETTESLLILLVDPLEDYLLRCKTTSALITSVYGYSMPDLTIVTFSRDRNYVERNERFVAKCDWNEWEQKTLRNEINWLSIIVK